MSRLTILFLLALPALAWTPPSWYVLRTLEQKTAQFASASAKASVALKSSGQASEGTQLEGICLLHLQRGGNAAVQMKLGSAKAASLQRGPVQETLEDPLLVPPELAVFLALLTHPDALAAQRMLEGVGIDASTTNVGRVGKRVATLIGLVRGPHLALDRETGLPLRLVSKDSTLIAQYDEEKGADALPKELSIERSGGRVLHLGGLAWKRGDAAPASQFSAKTFVFAKEILP